MSMGGGRVLLCLLLVFLFASLVYDLRVRRIPNLIVLPGAVIAVAGNAFFAGIEGAGMAVGGWLCGVAVLLPMYFLNAMGAGDVKLMGMVGAFVGPADVIGVALASFVAGGLLAVFVAIREHKVGVVSENIGDLVRASYLRLTGFGGCGVGREIKPAGHLPYAVAISVGAVVYLFGKTVV